MKKVLLILFLFSSTAALAQNEIHQKTVGVFINDFNIGDFEHIYQTFSAAMKKHRTKQHYFDFFTRVKTDSGKILSLELLKYRDKSGNSRGNYNGSFEFGNASVQISVNEKGEIIGIYIKKNTIL
ncbi:DUF3887 domain-containing protein [Flavobacterium sp.]|uniref:DUF3887 domain-containing protein n=1 Tax=Flavobacterium sp. TaxID=239 RepID=UPI0039E598D4